MIQALSIYTLPAYLRSNTTQPIRDFWASALLSGIYKQSLSGHMYNSQTESDEYCATAILELITLNKTPSQLCFKQTFQDCSNYFHIDGRAVANTTILQYNLTPTAQTFEHTTFFSLNDSSMPFASIASLIKSGYLICNPQDNTEYPLEKLLDPNHILKPSAVNILDYLNVPTLRLYRKETARVILPLI